MGIAGRIKEERGRIGLSQLQLAAEIGTTRHSVINWETDAAQPPAAAVAAMHKCGMDVMYILVGQRSQALPEVELLPSDERVLVDAYRRCGAPARQTLIQTAALLSAGMDAAPQSATGKAAKASIKTMKNTAPGAVQIGVQTGGKNTIKNLGK